MSEITWEFPVAADLFFAGLGAGSFCLGAIAARRKGLGWETCSRMSSLLAPIAIVIGLCMLILDLRNKTRFWMTLKVLNINSPMSIGVWLLSAFFLVSLVFAIYGLPGSSRKKIPWIGDLAAWNRPGWKSTLGIVGTFLALGVSVYTGVLLLVSIIPIWRNLSLPLLFFLSAISTGFAGGMILAMLSLKKEDPDAIEGPLRFIKLSYRVILPFYLLMALVFVLTLIISPASESHAIHFITGWSGLIWWAGVVGVGIITPLILVMNRPAIKTSQAWFIFSCVLIGGFLLRMVLILAGQRS